MTPKEKAEELVREYWICLQVALPYSKKAQDNAKQCALIGVNEILYNNCGSTTDFGVNAEDDELYIDEDFWREVKQEIEKL